MGMSLCPNCRKSLIFGECHCDEPKKKEADVAKEFLRIMALQVVERAYKEGQMSILRELRKCLPMAEKTKERRVFSLNEYDIEDMEKEID